MKFSKQNQSGSSIVIAIVVIVVVALIGLVGYLAYDNFIVKNNADESKVTEQSAVASDVDAITVPEKLNDVNDLDKSLSVLNQVTDSKTTEDVNLITEHAAEF